MRRGDFAVVVAALAALVMVSGCSQPQAAPPAAAAPAAPAKIPVTTASEDARKEYLEGRSLVERLLIQDSIAHFDKAIAADPSFALAELGRANSSPTGTEFLDHLKKAVALADKASDGERLQILAADAGSSGKCREAARVLEQLVAAYPQDERAHFALGAFLFGQQDPRGGDRALQERQRAGGRLLGAVQPDGLRVPADRRLRQRREGVQEVHPAHPERPEPVRLLRRTAAEDGPLRRLDRRSTGRRSRSIRTSSRRTWASRPT